MNFIMTPDNRPPRIIRFVNKMPTNTVALYNHATNVVVIDRWVFDMLSTDKQEKVLRTQADLTLSDVTEQMELHGDYQDWPRHVPNEEWSEAAE
jgi:hypothetical protein